MARIHAACIQRFGGPDVVVYEAMDLRDPGAGEVLIRTAAAAVNPVDWKIREGYMSRVFPVSFPYILGCEVSGTIEAVGAGVTQWKPGDAVFGYPNLASGGGYAEAIVLPATEVAAAPSNLDLAEVAALPVAAMTAYEGMMQMGALRAGERVLILGGAGGVGTAAIQLAVAAGTEVFATASTRNQDYLRQLGATPIDYTQESPAERVQDVDLVFDCVGVEAGLTALPCLKSGGRYVTSVYALPPQELIAPRQIRALMFGIQPSGEKLAAVARFVEEGVLRIPIEREFRLSDAVAALNASQSGRTRGKLLLRP